MKHASPNTERYKQKQEKMLKAAQDFIAGVPIQKVMNDYNVCYASVYNAIKRFNLKYDYTYGRTVFFNEHYFHVIDNEHKAYWLGFLFADGSIGKTYSKSPGFNRVTVSLSKKDKDHLETFCNDINMPLSQIKEYVNNGFSFGTAVTVYCNSLCMCNDLLALGYTGHKSDRQHMPSLESEYIRHFIRGYFDADGNIYGNFKKGQFSIQSSGTVILDIKQQLMIDCNLPSTKTFYERNSYNIKWGGRLQIERIYHYLYDNATVFLSRKHSSFVSRCFHR